MIPRQAPTYGSPRTLAWVVIAFLAAGMLADVGALVLQIGQWTALADKASPALAPHRLVLMARLGLYAGAAIGFLAWLHRAYLNLATFGLQRRHADSWVVLGFLVPLLNLVRPFEIVHEIWAGSQPPPRPGMRRSGPSALVPWWWALLVLSVLLEGFVWVPSMQGSLAAMLPLHVLLTLIRIAAAALGVLLVSDITGLQEARHGPSPAAAAWPVGGPAAAQAAPGSGRWRHLETLDASSIPADLELVVTAGADRGKVFPLIGAEIVIGRQDRTGAPPWGSIAVQEGSVSRIHAVLSWNSERNVYTIQHKSSTNMTVLNGRSIGIADVVPLTPGDHLRMGRLEVVVRPRAVQEERPAPFLAVEQAAAAQELASRPAEARPGEGVPPPLPRRRLEIAPEEVRETLRLDEAQAPPPARPDTVPAPPPLRLGTRRIEPIVPPVVSAASEETTEAAQPPPPPAPRPRNTPPEPATATPRSLFGLADVTPSAPPPRMLPHPVPPPGTAATPGLLPAKSRPEPPRPQPAHAEKSRTFYVPTAQLLQLPLSAEAIDSGFALQRASGDQVGALIPLRRTAYMLGRRDESGDPPHRISLEDVYLPREHAVLLWDPHAGGYRLHLMENSLVTTRVTRQEGSQSRDYLITSRQPFSLEADDEIALGDSRLFLRSTGSA